MQFYPAKGAGPLRCWWKDRIGITIDLVRRSELSGRDCSDVLAYERMPVRMLRSYVKHIGFFWRE